ncbi:MAG: GNAT family N-acetyltransferase [Candidatus Hermodarchaeota archaeon]
MNSMDQVFMGEKISFQRAIKQKKMLRCFIDVSEELGGEVPIAGSVALTWNPEENECYIGVLWIEPEFRGTGLATYILNEITNFADELGIVLTLLAIPFITPEIKPTDKDILELKDFYQQFGFRDNSKKKERGIDCSMERLPNTRLH